MWNGGLSIFNYDITCDISERKNESREQHETFESFWPFPPKKE